MLVPSLDLNQRPRLKRAPCSERGGGWLHASKGQRGKPQDRVQIILLCSACRSVQNGLIIPGKAALDAKESAKACQ
eukprot:3982275-Pleurochrysis_carterae.AAC.2